MTYLKVAWTHSLDDEPIELWSELDGERMELRKVERFRTGTLTFAGAGVSSGETRLGEAPVPELVVMEQDLQFKPMPIDQNEFEQAWRAATVSAAA